MYLCTSQDCTIIHHDVIKWKHFPRYWPFVRGIHRSPVNSPHKGQWRGALMFSLICVWINGWVNNREAGDLRPYRAHYDVTVMKGTKPRFPGIYIHGSYSMWWWYNYAGTQPWKNMITMGMIDTSNLMMIIRWVTNISSRSPLNLNRPI